MNRHYILKALIAIAFTMFFLSTFSANVSAIQTDNSSFEVIVSYKTGESTDELSEASFERLKPNKNFQETLKKTYEDIYFNVSGKQSPEQKLKTITEKYIKNGIVSQSEVLTSKKSKNEKNRLFRLVVKSNKFNKNLIHELENLDSIVFAEKNYDVKAQTQPNDTLYPNLWNHTKVSAIEALPLEEANSNIVAIIDTGVNLTHEDLPANILKGPNYIVPNTDPIDDNGHGTHIAGIISATRNNNKGIAGLSGNSQIMAIKALNSTSSGLMSSIISGVYYATDNGAKVINLSLSGEAPCPASMQGAIDYANTNNVTVVVAGGNNGLGTNALFPANCINVIAVGATGKDDERASYSAYGGAIDISAPGGNGSCADCLILSTYLGNDYVYSAGTSMAAPHVASAVSMILSKNQSLNPQEILNILVSTANDINTDFPIGKRLNIYNALNLVSLSKTPTVTPTPTLTITPSPTPTHTLTPTPTPIAISKNITWSTVLPSSSRLEYGLTSDLLHTTAEINTSPMVNNHAILLNNLLPCTTYYYRTVSKDSTNTISYSSILSFVSDSCIGASQVLSSTTSLINSVVGGTVNLLQSDNVRGVNVFFPPNFIQSGSAYTQIQRLQIEKVQSAISAPAEYSLIDPYIYDFKAILSPTTNVTSFPQNIFISVNFATSELAGFNISSIKIARHNGQSWNILSDCSLQQSNTKIICTTTQFSTFALIGKADPANTPTPQITNTKTPTLSVSPTLGCDIFNPPKAPDIFQIDALETEATIYLSPAGNPISYYFISYGNFIDATGYGGEFKSGNSTGVLSFKIQSLKPQTKYYIKARGGNPCKTGEWSTVTEFRTKGGHVAGVSNVSTETQNYSVQSQGVTSESNKTTYYVAPSKLPEAGGGFLNIAVFSVVAILIGVLL